MIELSWQNLITVAAIISAITAIATQAGKIVRWFDRQKNQDKELEAIRADHNKDMNNFRTEQSEKFQEIKAEQTILTYGILACLKGLKEQGCNGPVTEAINRIEKHLNIKAHE